MSPGTKTAGEPSAEAKLHLNPPARPGRLLFPAEPARAGLRPGNEHARRSPHAHPALHGDPHGGRASGRLFPRARPWARGSTYVVRPGDSLWAIAARLLRNHDPAAVAAAWPELYRLNAATIGPDPDLIHPGTELRLPATWRRGPAR
jgi:nucleoid-associated protein YgaU